jgi:hypothetical protein
VLDYHPLDTDPNIRLATRPERFPPHPFHLAWFPASDRWDLKLQVAIKTQLETPLSMMLISFTLAELEVVFGAVVRSRCQDVFAYATDTSSLLQNGRTIDDA